MSSNKNFPITRNRFNDIDDGNDTDDHHHYDSERYNHFHTLKEFHRNMNENNTRYNNNLIIAKNRQNNDIRNYQYYNYGTQWNKKQHQNQKPSIISISSAAVAIATGTAKDLKIKKNSKIKTEMILHRPSYRNYQEQQQQLNPYHQQFYNNDWNDNDGARNCRDVINWKNDSFFGNLNLLNDAIERPPNNNNRSNSIRRGIQKRNQNHHHYDYNQNQNQQQHQLKYEPLKPKIFGTFSFQRNIIDPGISTGNSSDSNNNKNNIKKEKKIITRMKNFTLFKNSTPSTPKTLTTTTIRKQIKLKRMYNDSVYPEIHHSDYNDCDDNNNNNDSNDSHDSDAYDTEVNTNENAYNDNVNKYNDSIKRKKIDTQTTKLRAFIIEFLEVASPHGFIYLAKGGLHILERIIWVLFIALATYGIISLGQRIWNRFQTSPMVITMDRNKLLWNTSFPSLTVCPYKRIDEAKVEEYMERHQKYFPNEEDRQMFREFAVNLANASYDNIEILVINKTFGIKSEKYRDLLHELQWNFSPEMSSGTHLKMYIYETITELGVCHSINSMVARYNSYEYWKYNNWDILDHGDKVTVHPLDGEIYAQIINLSTAYDVYFHGAMEVPDISKQKYTFPETDYTTVELTALEIFTDERARDFAVNQRKCRFHYESDDLMTTPVYTFGTCRTECRIKLSLKVCKCVPHFYRNQVRNGQVLPVCGIEQFECLARIKKEIISLKSDFMEIDCDCQPNCDNSNFFVKSYKSRIWFLGANLQWGISSYPKMQLRREVLFTFADVLVYIGGLAGFFMGCSILSFIEFIYFFTVRLIKRIFFA